MISLVMPPRTQVRPTTDGSICVIATPMGGCMHSCWQIPQIAKMLQDELGTASNIKSRVNRCVASRRPRRRDVLTVRSFVAVAVAGCRCCRPSRQHSSV